MSIEPKHEFKRTVIQDGPTYTTEQVFDRVAEIRTLKEKIDELNSTVKTLRDGLQIMVANTEIEPDGFKAFLFDTHYNYPEIRVGSLKLLVEKYDGHLDDWKRYVEGVYKSQCQKCGATIETIVGSRARHNAVKKQRRWACDECTQKEKDERHAQARRAIYERNLRLATLRDMPYQEYLQTDEWKDTRRRALKRARFACQVCNVKNTELHVHHRTYDNLGCEENTDLIVLCKRCHEKAHEVDQ